MTGVLEQLKVCESIPGWSGLSLCSRLFECARDAEPDGSNVEIGAYFGRTSVAIAKGLVAREKGDRLLCIDPMVDLPKEKALADHRKQWAPPYEDRWAEFVAGAGVSNADLMVAKSSDVQARRAVSAPIRFAFIDGDHQAPAVFQDAEWVMSLVAPGSIVALDDAGCNTHYWRVDEAIDRYVAPRCEEIVYEGGVQACRFFKVVK